MYSPAVKHGDTLILCTRKSIARVENVNYDAQQDALLHNKYLSPPLTRDIAKTLLVEVGTNFHLIGHKHYLPGGVAYEYGSTLDATLEEHYPNPNSCLNP